MNPVQLCLNNIIGKIEKKEDKESENIILMKVSCLKSPIAIDLNAIKTSPVLNGANVLKMLFCVSENSMFKQEFTTDKNNYYNLLENYNIQHYDWILLQKFIRTGQLPTGKDIRTGEDKIDILERTAEKLGGIPYLDSLLTYKNREIKPKTIKNPNEDIKDEYFWGFFNEQTSRSSYSVFLDFHKVSDGWSVASVEENGNIWFRKKKTN